MGYELLPESNEYVKILRGKGRFIFCAGKSFKLAKLDSHAAIFTGQLCMEDHADGAITFSHIVINYKSSVSVCYLIDKHKAIRENLLYDQARLMHCLQVMNQYNENVISLVALAMAEALKKISDKYSSTNEVKDKLQIELLRIRQEIDFFHYSGDNPPFLRKSLTLLTYPAMKDCYLDEEHSKILLRAVFARKKTFKDAIIDVFQCKGSKLIAHLFKVCQSEVYSFEETIHSYAGGGGGITTTDANINNSIGSGNFYASTSYQYQAVPITTTKKLGPRMGKVIKNNSTPVSLTGITISNSATTKLISTEIVYLPDVLMIGKIFAGLIPIDYFYLLSEESFTSGNMCVFDNYANCHEIRDFIELLPMSQRIRIFKQYSSGYGHIPDLVNQYFQYRFPSSFKKQKSRDLYPDGIQIPKKWRTLKELHDAISKDYNIIKSVESSKEIEYVNHLFVLDNVDFGDGYTSELPKSTSRIVEYGRLLNHCVASYADRCAESNNTIILSINRDGVPFYTLELVRTPEMKSQKFNQYTVKQFKSNENNIPKAEDVDFIITKLFATELISSVVEPKMHYDPIHVNDALRYALGAGVGRG